MEADVNARRKPRLSDRPTADLVVLFLAGVIGVILIITTLACIWIAIFNPHADESRVIQRIGSLLANMLGAIVGYMAGRAQGRDPE